MVDLMFHPTNVLFLNIAFLYYYINLNSPIIFCLSSGDMYLFLVLLFIISIIILRVCRRIWCACCFISYFVTNYISSFFCCFLNCSFWSSFYCIRCRLFSTIKKLLTIFIFIYKFLPMFLAKDKDPYPFTYILFYL